MRFKLEILIFIFLFLILNVSFANDNCWHKVKGTAESVFITNEKEGYYWMTNWGEHCGESISSGDAEIIRTNERWKE